MQDKTHRGSAAIPLILCAAAWALTAHAASAQAGPPATLAPGAGALVIDQNRLDRQLPSVAPSGAPARPAPVAETAAQAAPATALRQVRLQGSTRLAGEIDRIAAPFIGRPLDAAGIRAVADAVSAAYASTGLALYTVAAPAQDLSQGVLTLLAVEGHIGEVAIEGPTADAQNPLVKAYAARLTRERPLTKATMERYLSLIRDIPGLTVDAQLYNTPAPGTVRLVLKLKRKVMQRELTFNTRGAARLGAPQAQGSLIVNSLFRQGDQARLTLALPSNIDTFQYAAVSYASVLNAEGLTAQGNLSYLRTRPHSPPIKGESVGAGVQISYPIKRGYAENLYLSGGVDMLNSDNAIYGVTFTSDRARAARASLSYAKIEARRSLSAVVVATTGIDALGARVDARLTDADFHKLSIQAAVNQVVGKQVVIRLRGLVQVSSGLLPTAEQMPLGGEPFGRAFASAAATGDRGYAGSAELGWIVPAKVTARFQGSEIYGFADGGRIWSRARLPFLAAARYDLASVGGGVRIAATKTMVIGLEAAKAVDSPYPGGGKPWRGVVSWRIVR